MNIRVLDKNDKAALEQLIYTIENALPVAEWWIPIDDIERSHFFDADWTCFLGAFNDDNELVAASALFFNEHEFAEEAEKLGLDIHSTNVAEVGRCMVHPDFRGHNLMCELNKRLCSIARKRHGEHHIFYPIQQMFPSSCSLRHYPHLIVNQSNYQKSQYQSTDQPRHADYDDIFQPHHLIGIYPSPEYSIQNHTHQRDCKYNNQIETVVICFFHII